tara:strand:+ start:1090 stop:2154 length:1065 start_codon:yes stop_codon:yes gene_type:complete
MALTFRDNNGSPLSFTEMDSNFRYFTGSFENSGSITAASFVSSGNISASGNLFGDRAVITSYIQTPTVNSATNVVKIDDSLNVVGQITASGNVSASGNINADYFLSEGIQVVRHNFGVNYFGKTGIPTELVGNVTASGNISASGDLRADTLRVGVTNDNTNGLLISASTFNGDARDAQIIYPNHGLHFNSDISNNHVLALAGNNVGIRKEPDDGNALQVSGSISIVDGDIFGVTNITASYFVGDGSQLTNLQRPISSSVSINVTASNLNAGYYFRAGGNVTCSIQSSSLVSCNVGNEFEFFQTSSAGYILFETGSGVTLNSKDAKLKLAGQFSAATLKKVGSNPDTWDLIGDLG